MKNSDVEAEVIAIIAEYLGVDAKTITADTLLLSELSIDSFGAVQLMFEIGSAFRIDFADTDLQKIHRVSDIVDQIWLKKGP